MNKHSYVLCIGYRQQLAKALYKKGIPYSIYTDKKIKKEPKGVDQIIYGDIPSTTYKVRKMFEKISSLGVQPNFVIAGTEAAVYPASLLRSAFGARLSEHSMIRRCSSKAEMKAYLKQKNIPMTDFVIGTGQEKAKELIKRLSLPVVAKRVNDSGGRGVVICQSLPELEEQMGPGKIYEKFIDAPEGSVESFVHKGEILFSSVTEYYKKGVSNLVPASYPEDEIQEILELNKKVIKELRIVWGLTHLEFYRDAKGLLFGEVALRPPGGYIMKLIEEAYDFDPWQAFLQVELGEKPDLPKSLKASHFAACYIYHPGPGEVKKVNQELKLKTLSKHKVKIAVGDVTASRTGVGEDYGYTLLKSESLEDLLNDLKNPQLQHVVEI